MTLGSQDSRSPLTPAACVLAALGFIALATSLTAPTPSFDPSREAAPGLQAPAAAPAEADPVAVPQASAPATAQPSRPAP